jgi:hypothetical protein
MKKEELEEIKRRAVAHTVAVDSPDSDIMKLVAEVEKLRGLLRDLIDNTIYADSDLRFDAFKEALHELDEGKNGLDS